MSADPQVIVIERVPDKPPYIGDDGCWMLFDPAKKEWVNTGIKASGANGANGVTPHIGSNGCWWIGSTDTGVKAGGKSLEDSDVRIPNSVERTILLGENSGMTIRSEYSSLMVNKYGAFLNSGATGGMVNISSESNDASTALGAVNIGGSFQNVNISTSDNGRVNIWGEEGVFFTNEAPNQLLGLDANRKLSSMGGQWIKGNMVYKPGSYSSIAEIFFMVIGQMVIVRIWMTDDGDWSVDFNITNMPNMQQQNDMFMIGNAAEHAICSLLYQPTQQYKFSLSAMLSGAGDGSCAILIYKKA